MLKIRDQSIKTGFRFSFLFFFSQLSILIFFWNQLPPQGPLFYSRPWDSRQLTNSPWGYLLLPGLSFLVSIINLILASVLGREAKLASQLLVIFAALFNLLALITLLKIILLIT